MRSIKKGQLRIYVLFAVIVSLAGFLFFLYGQSSERSVARSKDSAYVVELRADGFFPEELTIPTGSRVIFTTTTNDYFWPASNPHPTHEIYFGFDPQHLIEHQESWTFTFDKEGMWRYHDHIKPSFTGTIIVEGKGNTIRPPDCKNSEKLARDKAQQCWDWLLADTLKEKGLNAALDFFANLYRTDARFASSGCHWYAHRLGEEFYAQTHLRYADLIQASGLPPETYYCGFGFFHGWLEHMFRETQDWNNAKVVCDNLDKELSGAILRIRLNCYHAMGHGAVVPPLSSKTWGNPNAVIEPALRLCNSISADPAEIRECIQGGFNVLADWMWRGEYGLKRPLSSAPLRFCESEEFTYDERLSCYYEMAMHLNDVGDNDLSRMAAFAQEVKDNETAGTIMDVVAAGVLSSGIINDDYTKYVNVCHQVQERLRLRCIGGLSGGFMAYGEPQKEYVKALAFCALKELREDERALCYKNSIRTFKGSYSKDKVGQICALIDETYRIFCSYDVPQPL
ncbi:MAG: hypothetical protein Q8R30_01770 [bacterium]|nr:hypothetical protein [bacterium]MDZ4285357.1 hypothetical protein [Candidatus Sungbacteria bacterium]